MNDGYHKKYQYSVQYDKVKTGLCGGSCDSPVPGFKSCIIPTSAIEIFTVDFLSAKQTQTCFVD